MRMTAGLAACLVLVVTAQQRPERIVSIVPSLTETLFAIGAGPQVVGVGSFDTHPSEVAPLPRDDGVGPHLDPAHDHVVGDVRGRVVDEVQR